MKSFYFLLSSIIRFSLSEESSDNYKIVPTVLTREECLSLREKKKVPNKDIMFCLARGMAHSALKAFYPVKNECDTNLNIAPGGKTCYSVRAWRKNSKDSNAQEHKHSQSLFLSLYYGLTKKRNSQEVERISSIELTLEKPLNCSAIYKPSKRLSHGRGSGSSYSISNITMDSTTHGGGMSVSIGYKTPLSGFIGGIEAEATTENLWTSTKGNDQGTTMTFKVPQGATCEPVLYQAALFCFRQAGKLKIINLNGNFEEIKLKDNNVEKGLLMPLDESQSDFFIPILACMGRK